MRKKRFERETWYQLGFGLALAAFSPTFLFFLFYSDTSDMEEWVPYIEKHLDDMIASLEKKTLGCDEREGDSRSRMDKECGLLFGASSAFLSISISTRPRTDLMRLVMDLDVPPTEGIRHLSSAIGKMYDHLLHIRWGVRYACEEKEYQLGMMLKHHDVHLLNMDETLDKLVHFRKEIKQSFAQHMKYSLPIAITNWLLVAFQIVGVYFLFKWIAAYWRRKKPTINWIKHLWG